MYQLSATNVSLGVEVRGGGRRFHGARARAMRHARVWVHGRAGERQSAFATGVGKTGPADRSSVNACAVSQ